MLFEGGKNTSDKIQFLSFCDGLNDSQIVQSSAEESHPWRGDANLSKCIDIFEGFKVRLSSLIDRDLKRMKSNSMEQDYQRYHSFLQNIPLTVTLNTTVHYYLVKCWSYEDEMIHLDSLLNDIIKLAANISETSSFSQALKYATEMLHLYEERKQYSEAEIENLYADVRTFCHNIYYLLSNTLDELEEPLAYFGDIRLHLRNSVIGQYYDIKDKFQKLYVRFFYNIVPTIDQADRYLDKNITKNELARKFNFPLFLLDLNDLIYLVRELEEMITNYIQQMLTSSNQVNIIYNRILSFDYPILNSYNIYNLPFVKAAAAIDDREIQELVQSLRDNVDDNLMQLWDISYSKLIAGVGDMKADIIRPVEDLVGQILQFSQSLEQFQKSLKIDADFFM